MKLVPQVRFKGFSDDWAHVVLGEVLEERNILQKISEDAPILAFAAGQGVIDRSERKSNNRDHLTRDQANKLYKLTELDDLVYNPANLKYGAIDRNKRGRGVISPIYVTFTTDQDASFVERIIKSERFKLRALLFEEGTVVKRQSVSPENLLSLEVGVSRCLAEQGKIGAYFQLLDRMIELHQRKHDKLVVLKKAMYQKMFPQEGATAPEIRFKGFEDEWSKRRLGEISDSCSGGTPEVGNNAYYGGDIPFIRSGEINASTTELTITELGLKNSAAKLVQKGDVLYALYGATSGEVGISQIDGAINQAILQIKPHAGLDSMFLAKWLRSKKHSIIATYLQGGQGNLSGNIVKSLEIDLPKIEEQQQIGLYFRKLDDLTSKHATHLEKLKNIKSACLEKMFV